MEKGIVIAGNLLADVVKNIDVYPKPGMMAYVSDISYAVGGCVPNTSIGVAKIDRSVPVKAMGKVGTDENGRYIVGELQKNGVDVSGIVVSKTSPTSFSDIMSMPSGERTIFHKKGAGTEFSPEDIDVSSLNCDIFHIGYILLLDKFDEKDEDFGTVMARFLKSVQEKGIKTSIDVVSDSCADYGKKIIPTLKYCNYVIINEIECCNIFNIDAYENGNLSRENVKVAMMKAAECGVADKVIVHCKKMAFALDVKTNEFCEVASLKIPKEEIKGSVGAGDAFCAGSLYALYKGFSDRKVLEFASAAAACNLFSANSVDGMKTKNEIMDIAKKYGRLSL